jgi:transcriptional regulator with XRE-family HTH domain
MSTELATGLVNRLRVARAERELSQDRLARAAGVRVDKRFWLEGDGR